MWFENSRYQLPWDGNYCELIWPWKMIYWAPSHVDGKGSSSVYFAEDSGCFLFFFLRALLYPPPLRCLAFLNPIAFSVLSSSAPSSGHSARRMDLPFNIVFAPSSACYPFHLRVLKVLRVISWQSRSHPPSSQAMWRFLEFKISRP